MSSETKITSLSRGSLMRQNVCQAPAPSSRAASNTSSGTFASPARKMTMKKPADSQPEITEKVNSRRASVNIPGDTRTPSLNRNPKASRNTTLDNNPGQED